MTDDIFNALVAKATGETVLEISRRGFHEAMPVDVRVDPEPGLPTLSDRPSTVSGSHDADVIDFGAFGIEWDEFLSGSRGNPAGCSRRVKRAGLFRSRRPRPARQPGGVR